MPGLSGWGRGAAGLALGLVAAFAAPGAYGNGDGWKELRHEAGQ